MPLNYTPINYKTWNFNGQGYNIFPSLSPIEQKIWNEALHLQDKRRDTGHAEVATRFASELLKNFSAAEREVIIPSIMLHDIGYEIDPDEFRKDFLSEPKDEGDKKRIKEIQKSIRLEHQVRGTVLAAKILDKIRYPSKYVGEILRINADHDTRLYETTSNGKIVQDADILWRITRPCIDAYLSKKSPQEIREISKRQTFPNLHSDFSKQIAEIELENSMKFYG